MIETKKSNFPTLSSNNIIELFTDEVASAPMQHNPNQSFRFHQQFLQEEEEFRSSVPTQLEQKETPLDVYDSVQFGLSTALQTTLFLLKIQQRLLYSSGLQLLN
jgi:hypothetical protein